MKKKTKNILVILIILLILLCPVKFKKDNEYIEYKTLLYKITKYSKLETNQNNISIKLFNIEIYNTLKKTKENEFMQENKNLSLNEINKISQIYSEMINYLLKKDSRLQKNIKFIYIDFTNFRRPLINEEKNMLKKGIKNKPIEEKIKLKILNNLKEKNKDIEIKQNTLKELKEEGLADSENGIKDGIIIYIPELPKIINNNNFEIRLIKYRDLSGAYSIKYKIDYENNKWKVLSEAIS